MVFFDSLFFEFGFDLGVYGFYRVAIGVVDSDAGVDFATEADDVLDDVGELVASVGGVEVVEGVD